MTKIRSLSIPIKSGQKKPGVFLGGEEIYNSYLKSKFINCNYKHEIFDLGNQDKSSVLFNLQKHIRETKDNEDFTFYLGGDHSMSMGTISGEFLNKDNKCVIWLDAHTDCNNLAKSLTGSIHGMPVAGLLGDLEEPYTNYKCLDYNEICYIGTRSVDDYEKEYIKKKDILNFGIDVVKYDVDKVLKLVDRFIANREVHISFDIDIMDPSLISSTGTPEEEGVNMEEMKKILLFLSKKNVKSMDIVELNPELGDLEETKKNLFELLDVFIGSRFNL